LLDPVLPGDVEKQPHDKDLFSRSLNISSFIARLHGSGFITSPLWAVSAMRAALEEGEASEVAVREYRIHSAASWIIFAGQALYTQVVEAPIEKPMS